MSINTIINNIINAINTYNEKDVREHITQSKDEWCVLYAKRTVKNNSHTVPMV